MGALRRIFQDFETSLVQIIFFWNLYIRLVIQIFCSNKKWQVF